MNGDNRQCGVFLKTHHTAQSYVVVFTPHQCQTGQNQTMVAVHGGGGLVVVVAVAAVVVAAVVVTATAVRAGDVSRATLMKHVQNTGHS